MKLLDLFCGAGGAAMGYYRAGFDEIVGVDIKPQPRYPFTFIQADAMTFPLDGFDAIHASPPCQGESIMRNLPWLRDKDYPMLIIPTRERLKEAGIPWVIENVQYARRSARKPNGMEAGWLCGVMFERTFYRHRLFESSFFWMQPGHPRHIYQIRAARTLGGRARAIVFAPRGSNTLSHGRKSDVQRAAEAMGIDWMTGDELSQAIPPVYTEYIGGALLAELR
jgi:DNA (cytosine-5)-methyltransferase 1